MTSIPCPQCGTQTEPGVVCASCGTPTPAPGAAASGDPYIKQWESIQVQLAKATAPKYVVTGILGYGGMAGVYLADEPKLGRKVAIKVMAPWLMVDPRLVERFEQEARTTAQLVHPNIVTIHEVDEREGLHWFAMTYVPGRTLAQVLSEAAEPLPINVACAWLLQIGSALAFAHTRGIVHRDVKPANVLIDPNGNALISDFGIAKVADSEASLTRTGTIVGTPTYMSPEQVAAGVVGGSSDQYSLGAVAYQMVTGRPPFEGSTMAVVQAHLTAQPTPIQDLRPDCPPRLAEAVERMLQKNPEDRWESVAAALESTGAQAMSIEGAVRQRMRALAVPTAMVQAVVPADVREGTRARLGVQLLDPSGKPLPARGVRWSSSNPEVACVTADNTLHSLSPGITTISASSGAAAFNVTIQVVPDAVRALTIREPAPISVGESRTLHIEVFDLEEKRLGDRAVLLRSSDPGIASVSADGIVQGVAPGSAKLTAVTGGRSAEVTIVVRRDRPRAVQTSQPEAARSVARSRSSPPLFELPDSAGYGAITKAFRRHLTIAVRLQAGGNLTSTSLESPSAEQLQALLADAEHRSAFLAAQQSADPADFENAEYAVNAFLDQEARLRFKDAWKPRNGDTHVASGFYRRLVNRRRTLRGTQNPDDVSEVYVLCLLLGWRGDANLHEASDVRAAVRDVVRLSGDFVTKLQPEPFAAPTHDPGIHRAYRLARVAVVALLIVSVAAAVVRAVVG